jgi:hypothetical protein
MAGLFDLINEKERDEYFYFHYKNSLKNFIKTFFRFNYIYSEIKDYNIIQNYNQKMIDCNYTKQIKPPNKKKIKTKLLRNQYENYLSKKYASEEKNSIVIENILKEHIQIFKYSIVYDDLKQNQNVDRIKMLLSLIIPILIALIAGYFNLFVKMLELSKK